LYYYGVLLKLRYIARVSKLSLVVTIESGKVR
jgi:hypothetical protein